MKTMMKSRWMFAVVTVIAWSLLGSVPVEAQDSENTLKKFKGNWGCSFESPVSFFGPLAGIAQLQLDGEGNLSGTETIASADPFIVVNAILSGKMSGEPDGTIAGDVTVQIDIPDVPPQTGPDDELKCVGMRKKNGKYRDMRCLGLLNEPEGTDLVTILECKRQ